MIFKNFTLFYLALAVASFVPNGFAAPTPADGDVSTSFDPPTNALPSPSTSGDTATSATPSPAPAESPIPSAANLVAAATTDVATSQPMPSSTPESGDPSPSASLTSGLATDSASTADVTQSTTPAGPTLNAKVQAESSADPAAQTTQAIGPEPSQTTAVVDDSAGASSSAPMQPSGLDLLSLSSNTAPTEQPTTQFTPTTLVVSPSFAFSSMQPMSFPTTSASPGQTTYVQPLPKTSSAIINPSSPSEGPPAPSEETERARRVAIAGTFLAIGSLLLFMGCAFCLRCRSSCTRRRRVDDPLAKVLGIPQDQKAQSSSTEKLQALSIALGTDRIALPALSSNVAAPDTGAEAHPPQGAPDFPRLQEWPFVSTNSAGAFEDVTYILSGGPYIEVDPEASSEYRNSAVFEDSSTYTGNRTSNGAVSVTAPSYVSCESRYSTPSADQHSPSPPPSPASPPDSPLIQTPKEPEYRALPTRPRSRSKTVSHGYAPAAVGFSSSKSFPESSSSSKSLNGDRASLSSGRSSGSEWVVRAYGSSRTSKLTMDAVSLDTIAEHVERIDVGGRQCVLMQG